MGEGNSFYSEFEECALEHMGLAGQDYFYDGEFWDNPNLTFPTQTLPSYQDFFDGFPKNPDGTWLYGADSIYNRVGGKVLKARQDFPDLTNNTCALKVSIGLVEAGIDIPNIPGSTLEGEDGNFYFLRAELLANWMKITFPNFNEYTFEDYANPDNPSETVSVDSLLGEDKGIIISVYGGFSSISGHADIYTGQNCSISGSGQCGLGGTVFFWQLN